MTGEKFRPDSTGGLELAVGVEKKEIFLFLFLFISTRTRKPVSAVRSVSASFCVLSKRRIWPTPLCVSLCLFLLLSQKSNPISVNQSRHLRHPLRICTRISRAVLVCIVLTINLDDLDDFFFTHINRNMF